MVGATFLSRSTRALCGTAFSAFAAIALAPSAHAMPGAAMVPAALAEMPTDCAPLSPAAPVAIAAPAPSKASQILGGTSALDAIRAQQAAPASHPLLAGGTTRKFEPAAAPAPRVQPACSLAQKPFSLEPQFTQRSPRFAIPRPTLAFVAPRPSGSRDIVLGSRMVPIGRTSFDAQWQRVSGARTDLAPTLATMAVAGTSRRDLIASVNSWVNRRIGHAEDTELFGRSDYWADAATTLRLGRGDCEDFALLKMELLAAAGVKREDMMLTLARDLIRRRDHAVLLVKTDEGFVMLDNVGSTPLDASRSHGYRPVMSLGAKQNFLHGY